jgi:hypothetical protein
MNRELQPEAHLTCDKCGRFGALDFGAQKLCPDCYGTSCSCCPEFGCEDESEPKED